MFFRKTYPLTWRERAEEAAEPTAGEFSGGFSDQVSRSAVEVCDFLTGVLFSILGPTHQIAPKSTTHKQILLLLLLAQNSLTQLGFCRKQ